MDTENADLKSKAADAAHFIPKKKDKGKSSSPLGGSGAESDPSAGLATPSTFKRGGKVKKTGMARVHKGERVLTKAQQKKAKKTKGRAKR